MDGTIAHLLDRLSLAQRWYVLTGAGCSTESGIPDYRDDDGQWKRKQPVQFREFMHDRRARCRYWARSMVGWIPFSRAQPGATHYSLARLEHSGRVEVLVTQNVDGLHQRAGSSQVVDLHGNLDRVSCTRCGAAISRAQMQSRLEGANPGWHFRHAIIAPDGDVDLDGADYDAFDVPSCTVCAGVLKPDVVFFGESVPRGRVEFCYEALARSDALVVVGSSLMVFSGYRFIKRAVEQRTPIYIVNRGKTRGDREAELKVNAPCAEVMQMLSERLAA